MKKRSMNWRKGLKYFLAMCLCAVMCAEAAMAELPAELGTGGEDDYLYYECTLPDGRLLMIGTKEETEAEGPIRKLWLECLNTDGSISWENIAADEWDCWVPYATVLEDGTIAVAFSQFRETENSIATKFFTPEGKSTGKETVIPADDISLWVHDATPDCLTLERQEYTEGQDEPRSRIECWDWDGNLIASYSPEDMNNGFFYRAEEADGVLLYGTDPEKRAKIMKKDSMEGAVLWETVLEHELAETEDAILFNVLKTEDGGYAALIDEYIPGALNGSLFLVKFDRSGQLEWKRPEDSENGERFHSFTVYGGRIAVYATLKENPETVQTFRWLDLNGTELGTTELTLKPENFPALRSGTGDGSELTISSLQMVPTKDGLLAVADGRKPFDPTREEDRGTVREFILVRIPEL